MWVVVEHTFTSVDYNKLNKLELDNLVNSYRKVKFRSSVNLAKREDVVKKLASKKDQFSKKVLWEYLLIEVKPLLEMFEEHDKQIVREYFRLIAKQKTIPLTLGYKIVL